MAATKRKGPTPAPPVDNPLTEPEVLTLVRQYREAVATRVEAQAASDAANAAAQAAADALAQALMEEEAAGAAMLTAAATPARPVDVVS